MLAAAIPLIGIGLGLTLSSDLHLKEVTAKKLWWGGFGAIMAGAAVMVAPISALGPMFG